MAQSEPTVITVDLNGEGGGIEFVPKRDYDTLHQQLAEAEKREKQLKEQVKQAADDRKQAADERDAQWERAEKAEQIKAERDHYKQMLLCLSDPKFNVELGEDAVYSYEAPPSVGLAIETLRRKSKDEMKTADHTTEYKPATTQNPDLPTAEEMGESIKKLMKAIRSL